MAILVTGFDAFGGNATNSSEIVVTALQAEWRDTRNCLRTAILRTEYEFAGDEIVRLIRDVEPTAVVCLGMHDQSKHVRVERIATNWDSCFLPDNAGIVRLGQLIIDGAPDSYVATLPVEKLVTLLEENLIGVTISSDAGSYVCNHVFFRACHEISVSRRHIPCGLMHIPPISQHFDARDIGLPLQVTLNAINLCIDKLLSFSHRAGEDDSGNVRTS
jgi:pyroglutamyl-peptidase